MTDKEKTDNDRERGRTLAFLAFEKDDQIQFMDYHRTDFSSTFLRAWNGAVHELEESGRAAYRQKLVGNAVLVFYVDPLREVASSLAS